MDKKVSRLLAFFLCGILLTVLFTGCITVEKTSLLKAIVETIPPKIKLEVKECFMAVLAQDNHTIVKSVLLVLI